MVHTQHNKQRRGGGFFLIIFGALIFILAPTYLIETPNLGIAAIVLGFLVGGIGFYLQFVKNRVKQNNS